MLLAALICIALAFLIILGATPSSGNASFTLSTQFNIQQNNGTLNPTTVGQQYSTLENFASVGTGPNQFVEVYSAILSIAASGNAALNLYGSLLDQLGNTINFAKVNMILVELLTTTTASSVTLQGGASNPFLGPLGGTSPTVNIANGGFCAFGRPDATGWPVTNSSVQNIKIANNDASNVATVRVTLLG